MFDYSLLSTHQLLAKTDNVTWRRYWETTDRTQDPNLQSYLNYIAALVDAIYASQAKRVFIVHSDRAYFLAGFLAALQLNLPIVLPPLDTPAFLKELIRLDDCLLTDQEGLSVVAPLCILMNKVLPDDQDTSFIVPNPHDVRVIFYTSGSTHTPKYVEKSLKQLEAEVSVLNATWSSIMPVILSTVSHQHIYGLLFSLLWPVCAGYQLKRQTFSFWEDLFQHMEKDNYIISSPSHLGRFPLLQQPVLSNARIFSSGGLLSFEAAQATQQYLGSLPLEIYGSTETGGIAYRQQQYPSAPWRCFPQIKTHVAKDQRLSIQSPYLKNHQIYQTDDRASLLNEEEFHLLGRVDRVVKVEGKRVSIAALEYRLLNLEDIQEVAVCILNHSHAVILGAVVVLTSQGTQKLDRIGKIIFVRQLRKTLTAYFDRVAIPKKWRFVDKIPVNAQGKKVLSTLQKLFM